MPYITKDRREYFDNLIDDLIIELTLEENVNPGEVVYVIYRILRGAYGLGDSARFKHYNEVLGILESTKLELYRRFQASYEDEKIQENGDVL